MKYSLSELIAIQLREHGITKTDASRMAREIEKTVEANVAAGDTLVLGSIGDLTKVTNAPRIGRNPKTGESIKIPQQDKIRFKPYRAYKKEMNRE